LLASLELIGLFSSCCCCASDSGFCKTRQNFENLIGYIEGLQGGNEMRKTVSCK
jgi:hypothetical protein